MTCSWCDKKISFLGAFGDAQYCCEAHKTKELERMKELAIQRLRNTPAFHPPAREGIATTELLEVRSSVTTTDEFEPAGA
jgi:hypothetical protein